MKLSESDYEQLFEALLDAFTHDTLAVMLRVKLGVRLGDIAAERGYRETVFQTLAWAESNDMVESLVTSAKAWVPTNKQIQALPVTFEDAGHVMGSRRVHTDQLDVFISQDNRDEQYQIVLNWNGQDKMRNFDLSRRNLSELVLDGADLRDANLSGANLFGSSMNHADLVGATLAGARINSVQLVGARLHEADLSSADLTGATVLRKAVLAGAKLDNADLSEADLTETILDSASLRGTTLDRARLVRSDLYRADLSDTSMLWVDLREATMLEAIFTGIDLRWAWLRNCMLDRHESSLAARWRLVWQVVNQQMDGISLAGADLSEANLHHVNLQRANLRHLNLYASDCSGASFRDADLSHANLRAANLQNSVLTGTQLFESYFDHLTKWPAGFDPLARGARNINASV